MLEHVANSAILSALVPPVYGEAPITFLGIGKGLQYFKKKIQHGEMLGLLQQLGQIQLKK